MTKAQLLLQFSPGDEWPKKKAAPKLMLPELTNVETDLF